jgi:hypothetical protein
MQYGARKFSNVSYKENDLKAKQMLITFLHNQGHTIKKESYQEDYDVDIVTEKDGETMYFEVEMKHKYKFHNRDTFPFPTVSFLGRKEKWKDKKFWYVIICDETKAAVFCDAQTIFRDEHIEQLHIQTEHRQGMDLFYRVPKDLCLFKKGSNFYYPDYQVTYQKIRLNLLD